MDSQTTANSAERDRQQSVDNYSMQSKSIIISEPLCYASRKMARFPAKILRQTLSNFYPTDVLHVAKDILINAVEELKIDNWVKPAKETKFEWMQKI